MRQLRAKWIAIGIAIIVAAIPTLLGIYVYNNYGVALFILVPFLIGLSTTILYGRQVEITRKESFIASLEALGVFSLSLLLFAVEGLICIAMAAPLAILLTWIGTIAGYSVLKHANKQANTFLLLTIFIVPLVSFAEKDQKPKLSKVVTSIDINAAPEIVWKSVVTFPQLEEPKEILFKTGIAYPINATINGSGVGAVRHCNFTTGSFVEPITTWDEPNLLAFSVEEQPAPMKEISFWDIDAPHLHDYFVSKQGQFKLTKLPNGNTRLEGTTWYYHNIRPAMYWQVWSDYIIHQIHLRVLRHIKKNAEGVA